MVIYWTDVKSRFRPPLAYLQELGLGSCRSPWGARHEQADRPRARDARSADSPPRREPAAARLGDLAAAPARLERRTPGPAGIALPRAPSARTARAHQGQVGRIRTQAQGQILRADTSRTPQAR